MSHTLFLKIALPVIAIPALIVLFLPAGVMSTYVSVVQPLSLLIGSILALYVSFIYRKQLRAAFVFLSAFLFIYMLAVILFLSRSPILLPYLQLYLGGVEILSLILGVQFITYVMLFLFCSNVLKVVDVTQLTRNGWILFAITCIFCIFLAIYPELDLIKSLLNGGLPADSGSYIKAVSYIVIRIVDAGLIIVLMPVLWLYLQYLKSQQRQSLTFTVVVFGIVCSTIFDFLFELIMKVFPRLLSGGSLLYTTIPQMLFIYGFLIIAVGLYAHRKQDEWGYKAVDSAMAGELKLVDVE